MTTRKKVRLAVSHCLRSNDCSICEACPYNEGTDYGCRARLRDDIIDLLKKSFTPQEVYDTVVEHAQHAMRFKLGDKIDYSFTDVVDILNMELMCKAGDM